MPAPKPIALEDFCEDILGKAQRGLGLSDEELARRAGLDAATVRALQTPPQDEAALAKVAPMLGLRTGALIESARKTWHPGVAAPDGLAQISTPWHSGVVNAYIAWDAASRRAVIFDTGSDATPLLAFVRERKLSVELILITHVHPDHVGRLSVLLASLGRPRVCVSGREPLPGVENVAPGAAFQVGALAIETRLSSGHSPSGLTYVVRGLAQPVAVVGDAIFAGSMGGARTTPAWVEAQKNIREQILSLPDETVLCPGHGPLTTVGMEKRHNPFFADNT